MATPYTNVQYKRFAQGLMTAAFATLYTTPNGCQDVIKDIVIDNVTNVAITVTVCLVPTGQLPGTGNAIFYQQSIPAFGFIHWTGVQVMNTADTISVETSTASSADITISGIEFSTTAVAPPPPPPPPPSVPGPITVANNSANMLTVSSGAATMWQEDNVWGATGLTRGTYTGLGGTTYQQSTGVTNAAGQIGPNGEANGRVTWGFPTGTTEVKSYPSLIYGAKPGFYDATWYTVGGLAVILANGTQDTTTIPAGPTPGTFLPLQCPLPTIYGKTAFQHNVTPTGRGQIGFDIWLQSSAAQTNTISVPPISHEIMIIHDNWGGYGLYPSGRNSAWYDHDVTLDGRLWHVYIAKNANGTIQAFSAGWTFIIFQADTTLIPIASTTTRIDLFINYLKTQTTLGQAWATGNEWLVDIEYGPEIVDGTGDLTMYNMLMTKVAATPPPPPPPPSGAIFGTNMSGMEWASSTLRIQANRPFINIGIPRKTDINYYASLGMKWLRLPISWEWLQPSMSDRTLMATAVTNVIGTAGTFDPHYVSFIQSVLDGALAAGVKILLDLHNYGRYNDFLYQADGSVTGWTVDTDAYIPPYSNVANQSVVRNMAGTAAQDGVHTISIAAFQNVWTQIAQKWATHGGLGAYGIMNEPHDLPDFTVWGPFAQAAISAIRAVDAVKPIYVSNEQFSSPMDLANATINPNAPYSGSNLIYEVHCYGDHTTSGALFDWNNEVAAGTSAGETGPINAQTIVNRLTYATNWAASHGSPGICWGEGGMPIDMSDGGFNWRAQYLNGANFAVANNIPFFSWMGGNHWPIQNYAINCVPSWYQNTTLEPLVAAEQKQAAGVVGYTLFDQTSAYSTGGAAVVVWVFARGNIGTSPITIIVSSNNGGTFSKTTLTIPAGSNGVDSFTFTPVANSVTTLTYSGTGQMPPPRKIYSLTTPESYSPLADGAACILAKYKAACWIMDDAFTDYFGGVASTTGTKIRAVADRFGYGGSGNSNGPVNIFGMLNWYNEDVTVTSTSTPMTCATCKVLASGHKALDVSGNGFSGLWCKKVVPNSQGTGSQPNPDNLALFNVQDAHFMVATAQMAVANWGVISHAGNPEAGQRAELYMNGLNPVARWTDGAGTQTTITSATAVALNTTFSVSMTCTAGAQALRLNGVSVGTPTTATMAAGTFDSHMIGWGWTNFFPNTDFGPVITGVIQGKGTPTAAELTALENYLLANS